jgi:hypothetical protein
MKRNKLICAALALMLCISCLAGCGQQTETEAAPDFSGYEKVVELSTLKCSYHNVAVIENAGDSKLFGLVNLNYKKAWFEYDGTVKLGIDVNKVSVGQPDANGVVTVTIPQAEVLGQADVDESTFSDVYSDKGLLAKVTTLDQKEAYETAQASMLESAQKNQDLLNKARDRAKTILEQYIKGVGEANGKSYSVKWVDAVEEEAATTE